VVVVFGKPFFHMCTTAPGYASPENITLVIKPPPPLSSVGVIFIIFPTVADTDTSSVAVMSKAKVECDTDIAITIIKINLVIDFRLYI
jgi:hypothetical protein